MAQEINTKNFVFVPYVDAMLRKVTKGSTRATVQVAVLMKRTAMINTPYRHGTNQRSIRRKTRGNSLAVWTTSGYGFWLEVIDRVYDFGHKGYMRQAFNKGIEAYPRFIRKAMDALPKVNPARPLI